MRAGSVRRGGLIAASGARPHAGLGRLADAVGSLFSAPDTVEFVPVEGVYEAELDPNGQHARAHGGKRVDPVQEAAPTRLYNRRAKEVYVRNLPTGLQLDARA